MCVHFAFTDFGAAVETAFAFDLFNFRLFLGSLDTPFAEIFLLRLWSLVETDSYGSGESPNNVAELCLAMTGAVKLPRYMGSSSDSGPKSEGGSWSSSSRSDNEVKDDGGLLSATGGLDLGSEDSA